jgi:haloalkane dehalogenase
MKCACSSLRIAVSGTQCAACKLHARLDSKRFSGEHQAMTFPESSSFLHAHGARQAYIDVGQGPPLVCVHGNPSWSYYYAPLIEALSGQHRMIVPDHIGMGRSDAPPPDRYDYHYGQRVADLSALLDSLALPEPITLVVHDWGGLIGLRYAVLHPQRIARLIILNTAAFPLLPGKKLPWTIGLTRNTKLGGWLARRHNAFARGAARFGVVHRLRAEVRERLLQPYNDPAKRLSILNFVRDIPLRPSDRGHAELVDTAERLNLLKGKPTLLLWGLKDFVFDGDYLAEFRRRLPAAEVEARASAGHYILLDEPDFCVQRVRRFLNEHP